MEECDEEWFDEAIDALIKSGIFGAVVEEDWS
jgi:hypothetical protein